MPFDVLTSKQENKRAAEGCRRLAAGRPHIYSFIPERLVREELPVSSLYRAQPNCGFITVS